MNLGDIDLLSDPNVADLVRFAQLHSLDEMVNAMSFVDALFVWRHTGSDDDDRLLFYILEKFRAKHSIDRRQQGKITQALREGHMRLPALVNLIRQDESQPSAPMPPVNHRGENVVLPAPAPARTGAPPTGTPKAYSIQTPERPQSLHLRGSLNRASSEPPIPQHTTGPTGGPPRR